MAQSGTYTTLGRDIPADIVFISYRRSDSLADVGRLSDSLIAEFGADFVFQDISNVRAGEKYPDELQSALDRTAALLVVIGKSWLTVSDDEGPRIFNTQDWVRSEIEYGLKADNVVVVPILLEDTTMPRPDQLPEPINELARTQTFRLRHDDWSSDVSNLAKRVSEIRSEASTIDLRNEDPSEYRSLVLLTTGPFRHAEVMPEIDRVTASQKMDSLGVRAEHSGTLLGAYDAYLLLSSSSYERLADGINLVGQRVGAILRTECLNVVPKTSYFFRHDMADELEPTHLLTFSCGTERYRDAMRFFRHLAEHDELHPFKVLYIGHVFGAVDMFWLLHVPPGRGYGEFLEEKFWPMGGRFGDYLTSNYRTYTIQPEQRLVSEPIQPAGDVSLKEEPGLQRDWPKGTRPRGSS